MPQKFLHKLRESLTREKGWNMKLHKSKFCPYSYFQPKSQHLLLVRIIGRIMTIFELNPGNKASIQSYYQSTPVLT